MAEKKSQLNTYIFIITLCLISGLLLATVSELLKNRQQEARKAYLYKQLLISARILSYDNYFQIPDKKGNFIQAKLQDDLLVPTDTPTKATQSEISKVFKTRVRPMLTDKDGNSFTFEQKEIDYETYLNIYESKGYTPYPYRLYYEIKANRKKEHMEKTPPYGFTIPINGYGLWDAIFGLLTLKPNGTTVIGVSWYEEKETPGLGGEISEKWWQIQFYNKQIFRQSPNERTNLKSASLGIDIVKPGVMKTLPKIKKEHAVDGVTGATITMNGVMLAFKDSLAPYRKLLININKKYGKTST